MALMNPALSQPAPTLAKSLPEGLDSIIGGLCQAMADQSGVDSFIAPICVLLWVRLLHTATRFESLWTRWREGRLRAARPPASDPPARRKRPVWPVALTEPKRSLPRTFGWLIKLVPQASVYGAQLGHFLATPEMLAFLDEVPQSARLLRPLCRTLGILPIPQMLRPQNPKPATPAPESAPPKKPPSETPGEPHTAETTEKQAPPESAKNANPAAPLSHADDPRWVRPVSLWCQPPRRRD